MTEDVVRSLGYLCLGSRLRRIGELLQGQTQAIIDAGGAPVQASHFPMLAAIDRVGPLSVGDLAAALGITQPGATRTAALLAEAGLLQIRRPREDKRVRLVDLTAEGRALVERSRREIWPLIAAAVAGLCDDLSGPLLDQLAAIEDGLASRPLAERAGDSMEKA